MVSRAAVTYKIQYEGVKKMQTELGLQIIHEPELNAVKLIVGKTRIVLIEEEIEIVYKFLKNVVESNSPLACGTSENLQAHS